MQQPSICLCMIVKDEAGVIERCLGSARGLIDHWVICDTGSTDGTQELIRGALDGVPGELHERPWVNFGHNRSEALELARSKADYLLLLDADMTITYSQAELQDLSADSYMVRHAEEPGYWVKRLIRGDQRWWYVGATHEYLATDTPDHSEQLDGIVVYHHADGGARDGRLERDRRLLLEELGHDPDNSRTVFYLAQTLRDLGRIDPAIRLYRRRAEMGGWDEEVYYSLYQAGVLADKAGRHDEAVVALFDAWSDRPTRAEPLYELARIFRESDEYHAAHLVSERGIRIRIPDDTLFVHKWMYEWGLLFEYSIAAYWAGQPRAALQACDRLLQMPNLPERYRRQTQANRDYCLNVVRRGNSNTQVSSTGSMSR